MACDFPTADLLDRTKTDVPAVIEHATSRIRLPRRHSASSHRGLDRTDGLNLVMNLGNAAATVKLLIRDRGSPFPAAFNAVLADAGIAQCCATCGCHA